MGLLQQLGVKFGDQTAAEAPPTVIKLEKVKDMMTSAAARPASLAMVIDAYCRRGLAPT